MKKFLLITIVLIAASAGILSADTADWTSNYKEGNVTLGLEAGLEYGPDMEISFYPTAEFILFKPDFGEVSFVDIGAKGYARLGMPLLFGGFDAGVGAAGTLHFGFKGMNIPEVSDYLDKLDIFAEIGICFDILRTSTYPVGMIVNSGLNYWLEDDIAVSLKYSSWNDYDGGTVAFLMKFKSQDKAEKAVDKAID